MAIAGWYRDPTGHGDGRYWDGQRWADQINRQGVTMTSPMDPAGAETPPVAGTEYVATPVAEATEVPTGPSPASAPRSPLGPVLGGLAVVLAIIALIIALNSGDDSDDQPTTTTTVEAPAATNPPETAPAPEE